MKILVIGGNEFVINLSLILEKLIEIETRRKQPRFLVTFIQTFHSYKVRANMNEKSNLQLKLNFILIWKSRKKLAFIQQFCNKTVKHMYKICFQNLFFRIQ